MRAATASRRPSWRSRPSCRVCGTRSASTRRPPTRWSRRSSPARRTTVSGVPLGRERGASHSERRARGNFFVFFFSVVFQWRYVCVYITIYWYYINFLWVFLCFDFPPLIQKTHKEPREPRLVEKMREKLKFSKKFDWDNEKSIL